jgi:hypothetical protein
LVVGAYSLKVVVFLSLNTNNGVKTSFVEKGPADMQDALSALKKKFGK